MSIFSFLKKKNKETTQQFISRLPYNEEVDPIAEATIYIAYGRIEQAKEILIEAKNQEPHRQDIQDLLDTIDNSKEKIKKESVIFNHTVKKSYLISLMVKHSSHTQSCPDTFEFISIYEMHTKNWYKQLKEEINAKEYDTWALLSTFEIKE